MNIIKNYSYYEHYNIINGISSVNVIKKTSEPSRSQHWTTTRPDPEGLLHGLEREVLTREARLHEVAWLSQCRSSCSQPFRDV